MSFRLRKTFPVKNSLIFICRVRLQNFLIYLMTELNGWVKKIFYMMYMEENPKLSTGNTYDSESLFWIGYTYRYWHFLTNDNSESIVKKCNAEMMHTLYPAYHTLDCAQAIERIIEA